jgi:predicted SAM-dependent methyltransferase
MNEEVSYTEIIRKSGEHLHKKWGDDFNRQNIEIGRDNGNGLRLNLGCGKFHLKGFINIDQSEKVKPDLLGDVLNLPYEEGSIEEIYAGHLLEHFAYLDGKRALNYWYSLLKPGGTIGVCVPNYDCIVDQFIKEPTADKLRELNDLYIYSYLQESPHKYCYNEALLKEVMEEAGFINLKRMPIDHQYYPFQVDLQVGYEGQKP